MLGVLAGVVVGFGLATALYRGFVRRLEERYQADADRRAAAATPVAVPPRDTQPTRRPRRRTARTPPAPSEPIAATTDDVTLPRDIVEQMYAQLARLDVLERRDALRVVRRTMRP